MSIGRRLTIAFAIVTLIIGCGAAVTSWQFIRVLRQTGALARVDDQVLALYRVRADVGAIRRRLERVSKERDISKFHSSANFLQKGLHHDIERSLEYFRETDTPIPTTLGALKDAVDDQFEALRRLAEAGDWDAVGLRLGHQVDEILDEVRDMVEQVDSGVADRRLRLMSEISADEHQAQLILTLTALISAVASLVLGWFVTRSIVRPLSHLKAAAHQFALADFNVALEAGAKDELGEVNTAFEVAARRLQDTYAALKRSNQELEQFAYVVSHDLQEPLRTLSIFADLLKRGNGSGLSGQSEAHLRRIQEAAARMRELLTGILEYSRLTEGDGQLHERVDMEEVLSVALMNLHGAIEENCAVVTHDPLPAVKGHKLQLAQLLQNLIGNSIKYARENVPPRIHVSVCGDGDGWRFCVQDNGVGIDAKHHHQIFGMFRQLDRGRRGGVGAGLAISKRIAEHHGGTISVASNVGEGARFYFSLSRAAG